MVGEWWQRKNFCDFTRLHTLSEVKEWHCILFVNEEMYSQEAWMSKVLWIEWKKDFFFLK
jgi:S-methylmethionine-dependent homocysteine/selenocysteine methylase